MADNLRRKCFKCGLSPREDLDLKLYRFPKPGNTNVRRCEAWAKFCLAESPWSSPEFQFQLYKEHRMLCHKHFTESQFINLHEKKLCKHAFPDIDKLENISPSCSDNTTVSQHTPSVVLVEITNKQYDKDVASVTNLVLGTNEKKT